MSSSITNDETATINSDIICDANIDNNESTTKSMDISSQITEPDEFSLVHDNKSQLVISIQIILDAARLACAFAVDVDKKTTGVLSQTKIIRALVKEMQMNIKKQKNCINARLVTLKLIQKMNNKSTSPNSVKIAEDILLLANNVLETAKHSVKQITDMVTIVVDTKKTSISVGKAILTIKTAILTAQQIANTEMTLTETVKDEINNALQLTKTALSDAIVSDINISSIKSQSEITKVAAVSALTYSKKTRNSAKANVTITKAALNNPNKITTNISLKPAKSIKDLKFKVQNSLIETNKIIERSTCIISKEQTAKQSITTTITSIEKIMETIERVLSLL
jgi:hypothetical protein